MPFFRVQKKGSFQKSPFSRDSRELRDSRDFGGPSDSGKQRRIRPFSTDFREFRDFRDSRDFSSEKTPFVMTPFSSPDFFIEKKRHINLRKTSGHRPGVPGTPWRDKQGATGRCSRDFLCLLQKKLYFCRDTGQVSWGHPAVQGALRNLSEFFLRASSAP